MQTQTHLLVARRQQHAVAPEDALRHHAAAVAGPRAVHLGEHPLVGAHRPRLVEVDAVVQAHHHAQARAALPVLQVGSHALELAPERDLLLRRLRQRRHLLRLEREPPEPVDPRHGADEVAVRHVRQRIQVRLVAAGRRDVAARPEPLPALALVRLGVGIAAAEHLDVMALERPGARPLGLAVPVIGRRDDAVRQRGRVAHLLLAAGGLAHEADGGGEDAAALLARLDGAGGEGAAVTHALDVVEDGNLVGAGEQEVAVARVREELVRHRLLRRRERLRDDGPAVDAARAGWMPLLAGV